MVYLLFYSAFSDIINPINNLAGCESSNTPLLLTALIGECLADRLEKDSMYIVQRKLRD
jgi:hypothetical protein